MADINSTLSTGLAALIATTSASKQRADNTAIQAPSKAASAIAAGAGLALSTRTSDAIAKINEILAGSTDQPAVQNAEVVISRERQDIVSSEGFTDEQIEGFKSLGADAYVIREYPQLDDAEFKSQVLDSLIRGGSSSLTGFSEALENGTLKIQRASDVPQLGSKTIEVTLYKDGYLHGSAGYGVANEDYWLELRKSGIFAATGSVSGNDYVVTWEMPWEADNSWLGTGIYET